MAASLQLNAKAFRTHFQLASVPRSKQAPKSCRIRCAATTPSKCYNITLLPGDGIGPERGIRRLCGRQALLDMIKKAETGRQSELQGLLEHRAVSQFAHRNRIQSLLRGRFLRNDRVVNSERPTSLAESELGLLRQRHTVSGLREGFSSRVDHTQVSSNDSDTSSNDESNGCTDDQTRANNAQDVLDEPREQPGPNNEKFSYEMSVLKFDVG
ncbi:3-isopropylmalate dehydrogenase, chloroplastic [Morella rubra]|uniref:3-isopropylmalate dehydrogenase, chloroplastic n=1 Tax=Morella rubra TaxID=262757 RepID=A0A6A1WBB0_9ROSI|nr:3-isopropylmalate dehydrogenase, chloroplastic [Morella rubra]